MKICVTNIPENGLDLRFSKDGGWFHALLPGKERINLSLQRVNVSLFVKRLHETVSIAGSIETIALAECCRCLEPAHLSLKTEFRYTLVPGDDNQEEDLELGPEDMEFSYYQDNTLDLDQVVFEQVILQIPVKALCKDLCKGLCPHCGINLNMASCNCHSDFVNGRLAVLKKIKV